MSRKSVILPAYSIEKPMMLQANQTRSLHLQLLLVEQNFGRHHLVLHTGAAEGHLHARRKRESKNLDGIVLNSPATLGANKGDFSFLSRRAAQFDEWGCISKSECARNLFDAIEGLAT